MYPCFPIELRTDINFPVRGRAKFRAFFLQCQQKRFAWVCILRSKLLQHCTVFGLSKRLNPVTSRCVSASYISKRFETLKIVTLKLTCKEYDPKYEPCKDYDPKAKNLV